MKLAVIQGFGEDVNRASPQEMHPKTRVKLGNHNDDGRLSGDIAASCRVVVPMRAGPAVKHQ